MQVAEADVHELMQEIWTSTIGLPCEPLYTAPESVTEHDMVMSCVQITGSWEGGVTVECSQELAKRIASSMLGMEDEELDTETIHDALGEVANMIGGNIKATLSGSCQLSLPTVVDGEHFTMSIQRARLVARSWCACDDEVVLVRVFEKNGDGAS